MDNTFESCRNPDDVQREAHEWAVRALGRLPTEMSITAALRYLTRGWGLQTSREWAENASVSSWKFARTRSFDVPYQMAPGKSAGGFDVGARPVSYSTYTVESIDAWARFRVLYE